MSNLKLIKPCGVQNIINKFCYTIGMLPTSYKMALTYEEQLLVIGRYLEETILPAINCNAEAVCELQKLFLELKNYVENYFDNLDVQEEINNKLNQMVEDGTLQEIITQYLQTAGILGFNTVADMKKATNIINGSFVKTYGFYNMNDGGGSFYKIRDITNEDVVDNITIIPITTNEQLIAELIYNKEINVKQFGAKGDGVTNDTTALQTCLDKVFDNSAIYFPYGTYLTTAPLVFKTNSKNLRLYSNGKSIIKANHTGDCLVLTALNENYGNHVIENLVIQGVNNYYSGTANFTSQGSGINLTRAYYNDIHNCNILGFKNGVLINSSIHNTITGNCFISNNEIGVLINGNAPNVNQICNARIRLNSKRGISIEGSTVGFPTANIIDNCYIETNIPYPYVNGGNAPSDSTGIYISKGYNNIINNTYFENLASAIYITNSSDGNKISNSFFTSSGSQYERYSTINIIGDYCNNNSVLNCYAPDSENVNNAVITSTNGQSNNQFINCQGFNVSYNNDKSRPDILNCIPSAGNAGYANAAISMPRAGYLENPGEGTGRGHISGIGTTNATLNAQSYGEVYFGSQITADTTITNIINLQRGQIITLFNYQIAHKVTIKAGDGINGIQLNNNQDCVLDNYSDSLTLYMTQFGRLIEIGRSIRS